MRISDWSSDVCSSDLKVNTPDMIITDINMPRMDGFGLIDALRSDGRHRHRPLLVLSTESSEEKKARAPAAGATGWIVKPFAPTKHAAAVRPAFHQHLRNQITTSPPHHTPPTTPH